MGWLPGSGADGQAARIWDRWASCQDLGLMGWLPGSGILMDRLPGSGTDGLAARIWD
jgi:hypothetical protein